MQNITSIGGPVLKPVLGQEAECLAVHGELVQFHVLQTELLDGPSQPFFHIFFAPCQRKLIWKNADRQVLSIFGKSAGQNVVQLQKKGHKLGYSEKDQDHHSVHTSVFPCLKRTLPTEKSKQSMEALGQWRSWSLWPLQNSKVARSQYAPQYTWCCSVA